MSTYTLMQNGQTKILRIFLTETATHIKYKVDTCK